jgi:NADPH:quinone reductase-like Zn-dependent oxidoreductase
MVERGTLRPVIDSEFSLVDAAKAHWRIESNGHIGKIVMKVA